MQICSRHKASGVALSALIASAGPADAYIIPIPILDPGAVAETVATLENVAQTVEAVTGVLEEVQRIGKILDGGALGMLSLLPLPLSDTQRAIAESLLKGEVPIGLLASQMIDASTLGPLQQKILSAATKAADSGSVDPLRSLAMEHAWSSGMAMATGVAEDVGWTQEPWQQTLLADVTAVSGEWRATGEAPGWQRVLALHSVQDPVRTAMGTAGQRVHPSLAPEVPGAVNALMEGHPPISVLTSAATNAAIAYADENIDVDALVEEVANAPRSTAEAILRKDRGGEERSSRDPEDWTAATGADDGRVDTDADGTVKTDEAAKKAWLREGGEMIDAALHKVDEIAAMAVPDRSQIAHIDRMKANIEHAIETAEETPERIINRVRARAVNALGTQVEAGVQKAVDAAVDMLPPGAVARARQACKAIALLIPKACSWTNQAKAAWRRTHTTATQGVAEYTELGFDNLYAMYTVRAEQRNNAVDGANGAEPPAAIAAALGELENAATEVLVNNVAHAELECTPPDVAGDAYEHISDESKRALDMAEPIATSGATTPADAYYSRSAVEAGDYVAREQLRQARWRRERRAALDMWASAVLVPEQAHDHREQLKALTERLGDCESLTCEMRTYADALRIEANAVVGEAEFTLTELRFRAASAMITQEIARR